MVSNICYFHPYLQKIPILTNTFQIGWNHQLVILPDMRSVISLDCSFWCTQTICRWYIYICDVQNLQKNVVYVHFIYRYLVSPANCQINSCFQPVTWFFTGMNDDKHPNIRNLWSGFSPTKRWSFSVYRCIHVYISLSLYTYIYIYIWVIIIFIYNKGNPPNMTWNL